MVVSHKIIVDLSTNRNMITYYLTLSQVFPSTHPRAGEATQFKSALNSAIMCARCQERPKGMCMGECVTGYRKLHTIRANYDFWAKRFEKIATGEAVLSIREWVGKPYGRGSTQREIALLTREDGIGIQKLEFWQDRHGNEGWNWFQIEGAYPVLNTVAENDGLSLKDWKDWFCDYDLLKPMAIIHFTKFRY